MEASLDGVGQGMGDVDAGIAEGDPGGVDRVRRLEAARPSVLTTHVATLPGAYATRMNRWWWPLLVLIATEGQLAVAEFVPGIERFEGKAFGARLIAYPILMLIVPVAWWLARRGRGSAPPYGAFTLIMVPFLIDVTGNSLNLYDSVSWWDDANHLVNWFLLCLGLGLLLFAPLPHAWQKVVATMGLGAILAIGWELGEWFAFIRHGTELDTAYQDTLGDEALGTLGALIAGLVLAWRGRRG